MHAERAAPSGSGAEETGTGPGATVCAVASLAVAASAVGIAYWLVAVTLAAVPELLAAAAVYALFLVWALAWILLAAGYQRVTGAADRPRSDV